MRPWMSPGSGSRPRGRARHIRHIRHCRRCRPRRRGRRHGTCPARPVGQRTRHGRRCGTRRQGRGLLDRLLTWRARDRRGHSAAGRGRDLPRVGQALRVRIVAVAQVALHAGVRLFDGRRRQEALRLFRLVGVVLHLVRDELHLRVRIAPVRALAIGELLERGEAIAAPLHQTVGAFLARHAARSQ